MAVIYATLIVKGKKTFADVPAKIQEQVKEVLIDLELPELAEI
ncbi:CD1375 family protein [uncultured Muribaculum sp.]